MRSIKSRLTFYIIFATVIPILAFLLYSFLFVNEGFRESEIDSNDVKITWTRQYLEQVNEQLEDIVYSLHLEEDLLGQIDDLNANTVEIEDIVKSTLYNNSNLLSKVTVISINSYKGVSFDYENGFSSKSYIYDDLFITPNNEAFGLRYYNDGSDIFVLHTINEFSTQNLQGLVVLKLSNDVFDELYSILGSNASFLLYSEDNVLLSNGVSESINLSDEYKRFQEIDDSVVWSERISDVELYISYIVPISEINSFSRSVFSLGLIIIFVSFFLSTLFSIYFTNDITSPIISLSNHMKNNDLSEYHGQTNKYQELDVLQTSYNSNVHEINDLITEKFKNEIERQSIQLRALQAQINPHFLSNTFQLIGGMALERDAEDIYDATIKMSKLVRYSMRIDQKAVVLSEELEHINGYLDIQKLRFGKKLKYDVSIDDSLVNYLIPKFTVQPIIENSFKYGLKKVTRLWEIRIYSEIKENIHIHIEDNGVGMDQDVVDSLNKLFLSNETSIEIDRDNKSVGLLNINSRIKLLYGQKYGIHIQNTNPGVKVTILLPKEEVKS